MKIGLLVPSRERLNLKLILISSIITSVNDISDINIYFGIDDDDPTRDIVYKIANAIPCVHIVDIHNEGKFIGINKIWNILAANCKDDIFGYIGDDMVFQTPNWDMSIIKEFHYGVPKDNIKLVHCWDGYHGPNLCVNAFMHRKYYEVMGYFTKEDFLINWSDRWMYQTMAAFNRITYLPNVHIQHNHWVFGGRAKDKTAERMLSNDKDKISDNLWISLTEERKKDVLKLGKYLNIEPDWSKVEI